MKKKKNCVRVDHHGLFLLDYCRIGIIQTAKSHLKKQAVQAEPGQPDQASVTGPSDNQEEAKSMPSV